MPPATLFPRSTEAAPAAAAHAGSVSVVMATYNGERFLKAQLDSLAAQTLRPAELVVQDDRSTDATLEALEAFGERAPFPVRVQRNGQTLGFRENFVRATLRATGDWVAFCDQDDVWRPHKLEAVAAAAVRHPGCVLVVHSAEQTDEALRPTGTRQPDYRREQARGPLQNRPLRWYSGFACTFDRRLLAGVDVSARPPDVDRPDSAQAHDQLVPLLANALGTTVFLPESLALYRRHEASVTGEAGSGLYRVDMRSRATQHLHVGAAEYRRLADTSRRTAAFLWETARHADAPRLACLERASAYYSAYGAALDTRAHVHEGPMGARARALFRLVRRGAYARISGGAGLGVRALAKDVALLMR